MKNLKNKKLISVIVPAHNEELLIANFLKAVQRECNQLDLDYEIVVVENGSVDRTYQIAREKAERDDNIRVLKLSEARYGLALVEGLKQARGKYAIVFNVDYWDKRFLALPKIDLLGYDIITASKLLPGSDDQRSFYRRSITWTLSKYLKVMFGYKGTDTHGIKALRVETVLPVVRNCQTSTGIFDSELMVRAQRKGLKILELPVTVQEIRSNRFGYRRILQTPFDIIKLSKALWT